MYENDDGPTAFFSVQLRDNEGAHDDNPAFFFQVWMGVALAIGFFAVCAVLGVLAGLAWLAFN